MDKTMVLYFADHEYMNVFDKTKCMDTHCNCAAEVEITGGIEHPGLCIPVVFYLCKFHYEQLTEKENLK
jgi:hypothetical protein